MKAEGETMVLADDSQKNTPSKDGDNRHTIPMANIIDSIRGILMEEGNPPNPPAPEKANMPNMNELAIPTLDDHQLMAQTGDNKLSQMMDNQNDDLIMGALDNIPPADDEPLVLGIDEEPMLLGAPDDDTIVMESLPTEQVPKEQHSAPAEPENTVHAPLLEVSSPVPQTVESAKPEPESEPRVPFNIPSQITVTVPRDDKNNSMDGGHSAFAPAQTAAPKPQNEAVWRDDPMVQASETIMDEQTERATDTAFDELKRTMQNTHRRHDLHGGNLPIGNGSVTLEMMVRESLKPMLSDWINNNLSDMVREIVQIEIQKVTSKYQS